MAPVFAGGPTDRAVARYLVLTQGQERCIVFARDRAHGRAFARELDALLPGCAAYVDCDTPARHRRRALEGLGAGGLRFVVNVRVLAEGVDCPACEAVVLLRVSSSEVFTVQAVGRALRPHPDKRLARV
jgi:superfamily II DNA or RNA helicase